MLICSTAIADEYYVLIGAKWCPGCVTTKRAFEKVIKFTYYDVDETPSSMKWLQGTTIPQTVKVQDKKIVKRKIGAMTVQEIKEFIK